MDMMWDSLVKLRKLPDDTQLYCGHEYTQANARFALTIEPNNETLRKRADDVTNLIGRGKPSIPTTIAQEKSFNPFLRADIPPVAAGMGMAAAAPARVFAEMRTRKDRF